MKRNCNNCKAFEQGIDRRPANCMLGYKIEVLKTYNNIPLSYKPMEECLKPLTMSELGYYHNIRMREK